MSDKAYVINDRRGSNPGVIAEACRVCGAPEIHTRAYNQPTMDCIQYLRTEIAKLKMREKDEPLMFKWYPAGVSGSDVKVRFGGYLPDTDMTILLDTGERFTGKPKFAHLEWMS